jgi:hypothetical protein
MQTLTVLTLQRVSAGDRRSIDAVDPAIRLADAGGWFDGEYRDTWPGFTAERYWRLAPTAGVRGGSAMLCWRKPISSWAAGPIRSICGRGRPG